MFIYLFSNFWTDATVTTSLDLFSTGPIATTDDTAVYFSSAVVGLNDTSVLIAYKSKSTAAGEERLFCKFPDQMNYRERCLTFYVRQIKRLV